MHVRKVGLFFSVNDMPCNANKGAFWKTVLKSRVIFLSTTPLVIVVIVKDATQNVTECKIESIAKYIEIYCFFFVYFFWQSVITYHFKNLRILTSRLWSTQLRPLTSI